MSDAVSSECASHMLRHPGPWPLQGRELFRRGVLSEAILALEAEVRRSPGHTAAWRLLGTAHAENEDDVQVTGPDTAGRVAGPAVPHHRQPTVYSM